MDPTHLEPIKDTSLTLVLEPGFDLETVMSDLRLVAGVRSLYLNRTPLRIKSEPVPFLDPLRPPRPRRLIQPDLE